MSSLHSPSVLQPSRLSEAIELAKKEIRIFSGLSASAGSVTAHNAPIQLRAFLEAKYAKQTNPAIQSISSATSQKDERLEDDYAPVVELRHEPVRQLAPIEYKEEEQEEMDALKYALHAQINSQNFLEKEVERLTVELNEKTRREFEMRPPRPIPTPSPTRSRTRKIQTGRTTQPITKRESREKKEIPKKMPAPKPPIEAQSSAKPSGKPDFYISPPKASLHLSRCGLKAQDKKVELENEKRLHTADQRLMETLRSVLKQKEKEKLKEVLLIKKRREARLRASIIKNPPTLPKAGSKQNILQDKKSVRKKPTLSQPILDDKKHASLNKPPANSKKLTPLLPSRTHQKPSEVLIDLYPIILENHDAAIEENGSIADKENDFTKEDLQNEIFDVRQDVMRDSQKEQVKDRVRNTSEAIQTEPIRIHDSISEDVIESEPQSKMAWLINEEGFHQVAIESESQEPFSSLGGPNLCNDVDEDDQGIFLHRNVVETVHIPEPKECSIVKESKILLSQKQVESISKSRDRYKSSMELWLGSLLDDGGLGPWDVLTEVSVELLDELLMTECSRLFLICDAFVDDMMDDELGPIDASHIQVGS